MRDAHAHPARIGGNIVHAIRCDLAVLLVLEVVHLHSSGIAFRPPLAAGNSVRKLLTEIGFSRQANRKADEGSSHPDRNAQFEYINAQVLAAQAAGQPVISVDTKKKELVGNYRNPGREWRPK